MPGAFVKVAGVWQAVGFPTVRVGGTYRQLDAAFVKVGGVWEAWYEEDIPLPGEVILNPTSSSIPGSVASSAWALFDTSPYLGSITGVRARISYASGILGEVDLNVNGRPSGTFYRSIADIRQWSGRTIDHQIDAGLSQFNAGTATGYTLTRGGGGNLVWTNFVTALRLKLILAP